MTDDELYRQYLAGDQTAGDAMTMHNKDRIVFRLTCRMEIEA